MLLIITIKKKHFLWNILHYRIEFSKLNKVFIKKNLTEIKNNNKNISSLWMC